jgi:hypothetical protein
MFLVCVRFLIYPPISRNKQTENKMPSSVWVGCGWKKKPARLQKLCFQRKENLSILSHQQQ